MEQEIGRLFEKFNEVPRQSDQSSLPGLLTIRPARMQDVGVLGRISADREGGDALAHCAVFKCAIEGDGVGRTSLVLVAAAEDDIIGFGKVRHLSEARADDGGQADQDADETVDKPKRKPRKTAKAGDSSPECLTCRRTYRARALPYFEAGVARVKAQLRMPLIWSSIVVERGTICEALRVTSFWIMGRPSE